MKKRLVMVEWIDAISHDGGAWLSTDDDNFMSAPSLEPSNCRSVGWVLKDTERYIHIAAHFSNDGTDMGSDICIPKGCIKRVKGLAIEF